MRLALLALVSARLVGQVNTGTLSGLVTDPSGTGIPGAILRIHNLETGVAATWVTNDNGLYKVPFLRPGPYSLRIEAKGFRGWETQLINVVVGQDATADVTLAIGDLSESITVAATASLIETATAQTSVHFGTRRILQLPRLSAGIDRLALLAPGVVRTNANVAENGAIFSANGQRPRSNGFLLDGQDNNHRIPTGPRFLLNIAEAISEYQVIGNQFSAEYGLAQGSIVNVTTRAGTNAFHGIVSWFHRNDAYLAALTNLQKRAGNLGPPKYIENRFGATLGGPLRRDKAFFFAYLDKLAARGDLRLEAGSGAVTPTVNGLRVLENAFPNSNTVSALLRYGPLSRPGGNPQFLAGSSQLVSVLSPTGAPVSIEVGRLVRFLKAPIDTLQAGGRFDLYFTPVNRLNVRYFHRESDDRSVPFTALAGYFLANRTPMRSAAVSWNRTFSPALVNEARFGLDTDVNEFLEPGGISYEQMGQSISEFSSPAGYLGFGFPNNHPQVARQRGVQLADNVSHYHGRHALKYGFQWSRMWSKIGTRHFYRGQFRFDTFQNFVDNKPVSFNGVDGPLYTPTVFSDEAIYFQDDFRVSAGLTVNLGLRHDLPTDLSKFAADITIPRERDPATAIWNPALPMEARTLPAVGRDSNNWAPRVGFAWSPRGRWFGDRSTVLRGGYGISYDFPYGLLGNFVLQTAPLVLRYLRADVVVPSDVTGDSVRRALQPQRGRVDPRQLTWARLSSDFHSPMLHSWSFGLQRRLTGLQMIEVRYVGNRGIGLFQSRNGNPNVQTWIDAGFPEAIPAGIRPGFNASCPTCTGRVDPNYGTMAIWANTGHSWYQALQSRYDGRLLPYLLLGATYTWSRSLDNVSDDALGSGGLAQNPFDITRGERGPSAFDAPHVFTFNFVWNLPSLASERRLLGRLLGGWSVAGIIRASSGTPATLVQRSSERLANDLDFNNAFNLIFDSRRPFSSNPGAPLNTVAFVLPDGTMVDVLQRDRSVTPATVRWIYNNNAAAHLMGTPFGVGRNVLRAPSVYQVDLSLFKEIRVDQRTTVQLRIEAENAPNHPNLGIGSTSADLPNFLNPTETQAAPRRLAVAMRVLF